MARYDTAGNCIGVMHFGYAFGTGIQVDTSDNVYINAWFRDELSIGSTSMTSFGDWDICIAKMDAITGIQHRPGQTDDKLFIYANPNRGIFNVEVPQEVMNEKQLTLKIFDNSNRLVKQQSLDMTEETLHVEVPDYKPGIYYLQLISNKRTYSGKMIVQ